MEPDKKEDYNAEEVLYCARCYSLKIVYEEAIDADCCGDCGCSDILSCSIDEWEELYKNRYGKKFVDRKTDPKKSYVFGLSMDGLKNEVYSSPSWVEIIHRMYPTFPGGLGKFDSIILFFDKLIKDNKMNDLRLLLLEYIKK